MCESARWNDPTHQMTIEIPCYSDRFALHAAAIARHLDADIHALVLNANFPRVSSALGNLLIDVPALIGSAKAKSRERGSAVIQAMKTEMGPLGIPLRTTQIECFPGAAGDVVSSIARYHDLVLVCIGASDVTPQATAEAAISDQADQPCWFRKTRRLRHSGMS